MSKKKDEPLESFPAGKRGSDPKYPADGWVVERRTERSESGHVGRHRDDGFPAGSADRDR